MEKKEQKIEKITLVKIENSYIDRKMTYIYSIKVSGIDGELLLSTSEKSLDIEGTKLEYNLELQTGEITDFVLS